MANTVSGRITPTIYLQAQQLHRARAVRIAYLCCAVLALAGAVGIALAYRWGLVVLAAGIGGLLGQWIAERFYVPYKVNKLHGQYKDLSGAFTMTWDAQHLQGQGPSGRSQRPWADYCKWKEDRHVFLLYIADNLYEVMPKAWFSDTAAVDDFRQCASQIGPPTP